MKPRKKRSPQQTTFLKALPPPVKNGDILDVDEAAALLKVSKKTVYARVRENAIPYAKLGRKLLFHKPSLVQWIAAGGDRAGQAGSEQMSFDGVCVACERKTGKLGANGETYCGFSISNAFEKRCMPYREH